MAESYDVAIKVISQKGNCHSGHKVGDEWVMRSHNHKTPPDICLFAFNSLYPLAQVLMYGGSFPWSTNPDVTSIACIDEDNPVVFELRRLRK
jgi:uncharacterized repeat protein (TIGR04076 family)